MPTYDYVCEACDHEFELFQSMTAPVKRKCPECGKLKLKRLIGTGAGVIFKGGGFYETDYRSDSYKKSAESEKKAAEAKPEKKDGAKKDGGKKDSTAATPAKKADGGSGGGASKKSGGSSGGSD